MSRETLPPELFLSQLLDASVEGILAFDCECRYTAWNQAMERISGVKRTDVLGKCAFDVFPFLIETGEDKCFLAALAGENSTSDNRPYTVPETGREGFFQGYYSPLRDQQNEIVGGVAVIHDITERKRAEEAAQEAHRRLTSHVENSPLAVIEWDSDFRVSRWSASAERLFGWRADEVIGKHVSDWHFVFDEDVDAVEQVTHRQRVGAELLGVQHNRNYTRDGSILYCEWYNSVLHDDSGKLVSVLSLVLDVTARKLVEEERASWLARERDARRQAEEADRLKDEFLATLSHELRTPLTSILGWASLIRSGEIDKEANLERALETIERNARSQGRLIDDLLDVSRIITGNLGLDLHPLNVAPIVEAAYDALRPAAAAKGIKIETVFEVEGCLVSGDANRLRQVIWNLLMNAIKFTPRGGRVSVRLECVVQCPMSNVQRPGASPASSLFPLRPNPSSYVRLTVSDTGEGISHEFLPYVFHRFRQEESSISRKAGGLGLGLAVVRHLVELHGGNVRAASDGPGQGSTFTVELPLIELPQAGERSDVSRIYGSSATEGKSISVDDAGNVASSVRAKVASLAKLDGVCVLLVENDDDSRNLLSMMLKRHGAEVIAACSSAEALEALDTKTNVDRDGSPSAAGVQGPTSNVQSQLNADSADVRDLQPSSPAGAPDSSASPFPLTHDPAYSRLPDIIISDIGMPDEDGYELIRKIRSPSADASLITHASSLIPAIALTGYATPKDRERALSAGYQLHLAKPIEPDDLVASILTLIEGR